MSIKSRIGKAKVDASYSKLRTVLACVESQSARYATLRSVCHFWILNNLICWLRAMSLFLQISPRKRSFLHNRFSPFIRSPGGFKKCQKISWNYHFKYTVICILHTVYNNNINKYCTKGCLLCTKYPIAYWIFKYKNADLQYFIIVISSHKKRKIWRT